MPNVLNYDFYFFLNFSDRLRWQVFHRQLLWKSFRNFSFLMKLYKFWIFVRFCKLLQLASFYCSFLSILVHINNIKKLEKPQVCLKFFCVIAWASIQFLSISKSCQERSSSLLRLLYNRRNPHGTSWTILLLQCILIGQLDSSGKKRAAIRKLTCPLSIFRCDTHVNERICSKHGEICNRQKFTWYPFTLLQIVLQSIEFLVQNSQRFLRRLGSLVLEQRNLKQKNNWQLRSTLANIFLLFWTYANFPHDSEQLKVKKQQLVDASQNPSVWRCKRRARSQVRNNCMRVCNDEAVVVERWHLKCRRLNRYHFQLNSFHTWWRGLIRKNSGDLCSFVSKSTFLNWNFKDVHKTAVMPYQTHIRTFISKLSCFITKITAYESK